MQLRAREGAAAAEDTAARGGTRRRARAPQTNTPNQQTNTHTDGSAQRSRRGSRALRHSDGPCACVMSACACACACVSACVRVHQITGENVSICTSEVVCQQMQYANCPRAKGARQEQVPSACARPAVGTTSTAPGGRASSKGQVPANTKTYDESANPSFADGLRTLWLGETHTGSSKCTQYCRLCTLVFAFDSGT